MIETPFEAQEASSVDPTHPQYMLLGANRQFQEIAKSLDGWQELVDVRNRLEETRVVQRVGWDDFAAAARIVDGESVETVAAERVAYDAEAEERRIASNYLDLAKRHLSGQARDWVDAHTPAIAEALTADLEASRASAAGLTVRDAADLERSPEKGDEYVAFVAAAKRFEEASRTVRQLVPITRFTWPGSELVAADEYPKLWSDFDLGKEPLVDGSGAVVGQSSVPWNIEQPRALFAHLSRASVTLSVAAGRRDLAKRQDAIAELAQQRRATRLEVA